MTVSSAVEVLGPEVDLDVLADNPDGAGARLLVAHGRDRVELRASLLDGAQHGPRGLVAADALEPVGDLPLPVAIDDHHQVQHPGGDERLVLGVAAEQQPPQRRLDRVRVGVLLEPDVLGHSRRQTRPSSSQPVGLFGARGAGRVLRDRRGLSSSQATRIGSITPHSASISSLRVNSVASPRIASRISRS